MKRCACWVPLLLGCVVLTGCRDVIEPDAVEQIGPKRVVEGTLGSFSGLDVPSGRVTLRRVTDVGIVDAPLASSDLREGGAFTLELARGTDGFGVLSVEWDAPSIFADFRFANLPLRGNVIEVDYAPRHVTGRVVWPDGIVLLPDEYWSFRFRNLERLVNGVGLITDVLVEPDAGGAFDRFVPDREFAPTVQANAIEGLDFVNIEYYPTAFEDDMALAVPLRPVTYRIVVPPNLGSDVRIELTGSEWGEVFESDLIEDIDTKVTVDAVASTVASWWPAPYNRFTISPSVPHVRSVVFVGLDRTREIDVEAVGDTYDVVLGRALVRVVVLRGQEAVEDVEVRAPWAGYRERGSTDVNGTIDFAFPQPGPARIEVSTDAGWIAREVDVFDYAEIIVDLDGVGSSDAEID